MQYTSFQTSLRSPIAFWHGRGGLLLQLLFFVLGLRWLLSFSQSFLSPGLPASVITGWIILNVAIFVWQMVGAYRSLVSHSRESSDTALVWVGWFVVLVSLILSAVQGINLANLGAPDRETILMNNYHPPELKVVENGTVAVISGDLDYKANTGLLNAIKTYPELNTIHLESDGGLVYAARALARNIQKAQLNTFVERRCTSSCTLVFLSGAGRKLGEEAKLGFHQYGLLSRFHNSTVSFDVEQDKDRDFALSRGVSADFAGQMFSHAHTDMWFPSRELLYSSGVITSP